TIDEYYRYIFERVPGLPQAAAAKGLEPLAYMRQFGAFEVQKSTFRRHERHLSKDEVAGAEIDPASKVVLKSGRAMGIQQFLPDPWRMPGQAEEPSCVEGFPTPSRKQEFYSPTLVDWGWPEFAIPGYIPSQVDWHD